ncbi:MAG: hypothetical protein ACPGVU_04815 [Limisphaerales bacterium]
MNLLIFVLAICRATVELRDWSERRREKMFQNKHPDIEDWLLKKEKSKAKPYDKDEPDAGPIIDV